MKVALIAALLTLAACSSGSQYLEDNRKAVGIPEDWIVRYCPAGHDHAGMCNYDTRTICIHPAWLWEGNIWVKGVLIHEYVHTLGYDDHSPLFRSVCDREADRVGIPRWAVPDGHRPNRLECSRVVSDLCNGKSINTIAENPAFRK